MPEIAAIAAHIAASNSRKQILNSQYCGLLRPFDDSPL